MGSDQLHVVRAYVGFAERRGGSDQLASKAWW